MSDHREFADRILAVIDGEPVCQDDALPCRGCMRDEADRAQVESCLVAIARAEEGFRDSEMRDRDVQYVQRNMRRYTKFRDDALADLARVGQTYGVRP